MKIRINWRAIHLMFLNLLIAVCAVEFSTGLVSGKYSLTALVACAIMSAGILSACFALKYLWITMLNIFCVILFDTGDK